MNDFLAILLMLIPPWVTASTSVTLAWDPNPEPDLASYVIYYGPESRSYTHATNVGNVTLATVRGLEDFKVYHFAVTAVSTAGLESDFSDEVTNTVDCVILTLEKSVSPTGPWFQVYSNVVPRFEATLFRTKVEFMFPTTWWMTNYSYRESNLLMRTMERMPPVPFRGTNR